jgi:adrenodoxin-NADP+ reductase
MMDSFDTAENLVADYSSRSLDSSPKPGFDGVKSLIAGQRVSWSDWQKIDRAERELGVKAGKPRVKFQSIADMLSVI